MTLHDEIDFQTLKVSELIICQGPSVVSTILGSCVSVCIFSRESRVGGMIHFSLPDAPLNYAGDDSFRYGSLAIPYLIEEICHTCGIAMGELKAKIAGGAEEDQNINSLDLKVGKRNVEIARRVLAEYGIEIVGEAVGGQKGRKVLFHTATGRLQVSEISVPKRNVSNASLSTSKSINRQTRSRNSGVESIQAQPPRRHKVLIVDDSKIMRNMIARILTEDKDFEVVGTASDAIEAEQKVNELNPDVMTLDVYMPEITGVEFLEKLLPKKPIPVVMITSLQMQEGNEVFRALEIGAIDYIQKPKLSEISEVSATIRERVKVAATSKVFYRQQKSIEKVKENDISLNKVLCIGASTGGTEAIRSVMCAMPDCIPATLIVQHIPPSFSKAFADRLNELCPFEVKEAEDGDELRPSRVLIAPGGKQMKIVETVNGLCVRITDDPPVNRHKPSIDYLFSSAAKLLGKDSVGIILTGMGADGAKGLLEMRTAGARTLGQDEKSCVVYGMPKVAFEIGAVEKEVSVDKMSYEICNLLSEGTQSSSKIRRAAR